MDKKTNSESKYDNSDIHYYRSSLKARLGLFLPGLSVDAHIFLLLAIMFFSGNWYVTGILSALILYIVIAEFLGLALNELYRRVRATIAGKSRYIGSIKLNRKRFKYDR